MSPLTRLPIALLVFTLAACGGKSSERGDDGTGTNGSGGSDTGGTGTGGANQAGHAGTGGSICTSYDDDYAASVNVSIVNQTTMTLYLGQSTVSCRVDPFFQVAYADGTQLPPLDGCRSPCASLRQQGPAGCIGLCALPNSVQLLPGERLSTTWDGLFLRQQQLPSTCVAEPTGGAAKVTCDQAKRIEPGTFTFSARAGGAIDCSQMNVDGACPPCTASPNGGCARSGTLIAGPLHATEVTVALDETYGIYPAPSPAPLPNGSADAPAPGGNVALRTVELVFND